MFHLLRKKPLNYENRAGDYPPYMILLHYTGMESFEAARDRLSDPESKVSAHYIVDEDGTALSLVPEEKRAWHAGVSYWAGDKDINSASIGIEMVNPGHEFGYRPFPPAQMQTVIKLCQEIMQAHNIIYVLGHSDVAPERKQDPGELFNWKELAAHGVGLWPNPTEEEFERAEKISINDFETEKLFIEYGYNPTTAFVDVVTAFHRHYCPELFQGENVGQPCVKTVARILSLIRQQKQI